MSAIGIQALPSATTDAKRLALRLGVKIHEIALHRFPDGEFLVTVGPAAPTTIIYGSLDHPNDKLLAVLFAAEALRRGGAKRLVLLTPYLCYMRQDISFHKGEAISQKVVGALLAGSLDRVITVDAHLHRTTDIRNVFPGIESENLSAMPAIAASLQTTGFDPNTVIVGPDAESKPWVSNLADRLGLTYVVAQKIRCGDRSVEIVFANPALLTNRSVVLVDDIVSSGGTLIACAKSLKEAGACAIDAVVTHALFPENLTRDFTSAGIRSVRSTHSVLHSTNAIILDELFTDALRSEMIEAPLSEYHS